VKLWYNPVSLFVIAALLAGVTLLLAQARPAYAGPNAWPWMGGSNTRHQCGACGVMGVPTSTNIPGAREGAVTWVDGAGNSWPFGGYGCDSVADNRLVLDEEVRN